MPLDAFFRTELGYFVLLFALFVIPRALQRWRMPAAITALLLGVLAGPGFGLLHDDTTLHLLSTFGIVALFLFAGLEVELGDLRREGRVFGQHLLVQAVLLALAATAVGLIFKLSPRAAVIAGLALVTPSTGFIIDALDTFGLDEAERFWVRNKAIAAELLALALLFVAMQTTSLQRLLLATVALVAIIAILPPLFRLFARVIAPYAPKSEFAFLLMMALLASYGTRRLGVYYLVGAFLVGVAAERLRRDLPAEASTRLIGAVELFASFFAPFYFFGAGVGLAREDFSWSAVALGGGLAVVMVAVRVAGVTWHRRIVFGESRRSALRIAVPMVPTLVFTIVLATILRDEFGAPSLLVGALMVYTIVNTLVPGFALGKAVPTYPEE